MIRLIRKFAHDANGSIALAMGLSAVVLFVTVGVGLDFEVWSKQRTDLQAAADDAALAAVQMYGSGTPTQTALETRVGLYITQDLATTATTTVTKSDANKTVTVAISQSGRRSLSSFVWSTNPTVVARATAKLVSGNMPLCVLALNPTSTKAIEGSGGTQWTGTNCIVQSNSNSSSSIVLSGNSTITSGKNCFVGGVSQGLSGVTPAPTVPCPVFPDPFSSMILPTVGACDHTAMSVNTPQTLQPGVYCGGLTVANVAFTFAPGLYIIKDGTFKSTGGAQLTGDGVTFFLTGNKPALNWSGGTGTYNFKAMRTGTLAGFVIYTDPAATPASKSVISGGGATYYEGVIYIPNQLLEISGTGSVSPTISPFTSLVADKFLFSGGSTLTFKGDYASSSVPMPSGLMTGRNGPLLTY